MAKTDNLTDFLVDVADAIREKKGTSDLINPQSFSDEIRAFEIGGGEPSVPDDGKTRLYISVPKGRQDVPLYFSQTLANGVTIDWGDGSATQSLGGSGNVNTTHHYNEIGGYVISLDVADGCTLGLGHNSSSYCVMGSTGNNGRVYCNMLQRAEIGKGVTSIGTYAFYYCYSLASVVIPQGVTSIGSFAFYFCYSLASVVIPQGVTSIGSFAFSSCLSLASVVIPQGVTSIGFEAFSSCYSIASVVIPQGVTSIESSAFYFCYGMAFYDFRASTSVPSLSSTSAFKGIPSDCKIVVPDALYDSWIAATNWSSYASNIVKASEFNG